MAVNNAQGFATLRGWIDGLKEMETLAKRAPAELAPVVKSECDRTISAGESLDGEKWPPTVKDGKQALQGSQKDLTVTASGAVIWIRIVKGLVWSQFGTHRQVARRILPSSGMPKKLGNAIRLGIVEMAPEFLSRKGGHKKPTRGIKWQ